MDSVPRISRAQKMDALSSMANIAGYRAVIEAAQHFGRFFTGQITAAGRIPPAKVLVIGAGVAGLAAIGAARALGAIVRAFDTRPEVKEQVESMDGEFLDARLQGRRRGRQGGYAKVMSPEFIKAEMALFAEQAKDVDIIITTALIPGKPAPKLITADMVALDEARQRHRRPRGRAGRQLRAHASRARSSKRHGVTIIGYTDLPSRLATQSSQLYATNLRHLLTDMCPKKDGVLVVDIDDEVVRGATVVKDGAITWPPPAPKLVGGAGEARARPTPRAEDGRRRKKPRERRRARSWRCSSARPRSRGLGAVAPPSFLAHFTVFVLACFVGYMVVWNVTPALHTPLMSVTNAISSIIIIGALLQVSASQPVVIWIAGVTIAAHQHQHRRRLRGHAAHARDVPEVGSARDRWPRHRRLHRRRRSCSSSRSAA